MQCMECFLSFFRGIPGISIGYAGIGITYLCTGLLERFREKLAHPRIHISRGLLIVGVLFISFFALILNGVMGVRVDVDSARILAYLGIGGGLICGAWAARSQGKIPRIMMGWGLFFKATGAILLFS